MPRMRRIGRVRRLATGSGIVLALVVLAPGAALACGGLVAPGHAEVLRRATTLAAWHDGYEHYVTGFTFAGSASSFGYIIPLPGVPSKIEKAGDWTLERLQLEVDPVPAVAFLARSDAAAGVSVLQKVRIEALDITVVRGGGHEVAAWAEENGFDLTPDTPRVLGAYSSRGSVFALARFDAPDARERGLVEGEGTVIHFTIPTRAPWIPLRILGLGKGGSEVVAADLFVLTEGRPSLDPALASIDGIEVRSDGPASPSLLSDLRSDRGMGWLPESGMWLTALSLRVPAGTLTYDLSIDGGGPLLVAPPRARAPAAIPWGWPLAGAVAAAAVMGIALGLPRPRPATT